MLHVALDQAYYDNLISSNSVNGVRLPVPDSPEQRVLRPEEKEQICTHAATIHTLPAQGVILLLTCGLRRGELLELQWQDVDLEHGLIKIRHTMSRLKKFDVSKTAYPYIQLDTDLVFCTEEGHPFEAKVLEDGFQKILAELHLKSVNIHATRHTFATEALQKATDIITVSEILGHTKPSTTLDMYGHTFDDRKRALMAQM